MASELLNIIIKADTSGFGRAMGQAQVTTGKFGKSVDLAEGKAKTFGSRLAGFGKVAALGLAGVGLAAATLGKDFVKAAEESNKVTAQTDAVIKSMGLSAQVSAGEIAKLSEKLSLKSGVDDEAIQSASNLLLTFRSLAETAGETGGNFDRATQAALDMSVALGTDMSSAAMTVGKSLNDPIRGLTALRRAGIQFTAAQEDQIRAMVEAGDVAGAQKLILAELEAQFGGSAAAQADASDKLAVAWGNLQETLGEKLLPVVEKFSTWLTETGIPAIESMIGFIERNQAAFTVLAAVVGGVLVAAFAAWAVALIAPIAPILLIGAAVAAVAALVVIHFDTIKNAFMTAFNWLKENWPLVLGILTGPIGLAVLAIAKHWGTIKDGIKALKGWISDTASGMWEGLKSGLVAVVNWIIRRLNEIVNAIDVLAGPFVNLPAIPQLGGSSGGGGGSTTRNRTPGGVRGNRQHGGPVSAGGAYVVGEAGPEWLVMGNTSGHIVPAGGFGMGGGGGGTVVNIALDMRGSVISDRRQFDDMVKRSFQRLGDNNNLPTIRGRQM